MRKPQILPLLAMALLPACTATIPPVEVTRFHLGQSIAPGAFSVSAAIGEDGKSIEFRTYTIAVGRELARLGFIEGNAPAYIAEIGHERATRTDVARRSPISIGIGGGSFGRNVGIGVGTSFGVGGPSSRDIVRTQLSVKLLRKSDQQVVWEGRAVTEAGSNAPAAQPGLAAEKLSRALFAGFPGESGKTVMVP